MATSAYFTAAEAPTYLKDVATAPNAAVFNYFASVITDWIDEATGQYFFADGYDTKWFDAGDYTQQGNIISFEGHPMYGKVGNIAAVGIGATTLVYTPYRGPVPNNLDVLTLGTDVTQEQVTVNAAPTSNGDGTWNVPIAAPGTKFAHVAKTLSNNIVVQLAYFENQPIANWTTALSGDGIRPPSNFFLWPRNPKPYQSADPLSRKPWEGLDIAHIPISATAYLPTPIPGYLTIGIGANWGWPAIPTPVKDFVGRLTIKMWRARGTGWNEQLGGKEVGQVQHILAEFGALDEFMLLASSYKRVAI